MTKEQFIEKWIDRYMDEHPDEKITDFDALREQADCEWYDNEVDHGKATEYDLTAEQAKVAQDAMKGMARAVNAYGKEVKRERKPNENKRWIIERVKILLDGFALKGDLEAVEVANVERQVDFVKDGKHYTLTLTEHRPPKTK
jgi:hypothetical protein